MNDQMCPSQIDAAADAGGKLIVTRDGEAACWRQVVFVHVVLWSQFAFCAAVPIGNRVESKDRPAACLWCLHTLGSLLGSSASLQATRPMVISPTRYSFLEFEQQHLQ